MSYYRSILIFFLAFSISGCESLNLVPKVEDSQLRIIQRGYSLVPTNETGWVMPARSSSQLVLIRNENNLSNLTSSIEATLFYLPDFSTKDELLKLIQKGQKANIDTSLFSVLTHEVIEYKYKPANCAHTHLLAIDIDASKKSNSADKILLETASLVCAHPQNKSIGLSITYSQRYNSSDKRSGFLDRASMVIDSVRFEKLNY